MHVIGALLYLALFAVLAWVWVVERRMRDEP
jgi:hypothetical protein